MSPDEIRNALTPQIAKLIAEVQAARQDIRNLHDSAKPAKDHIQNALFAASEIVHRADKALTTINDLISRGHVEAESLERRIRMPPEPRGLMWMLFIGWVGGAGCVLAYLQFS